MKKVEVEIVLGKDALLPSYESLKAAGADLRANFSNTKGIKGVNISTQVVSDERGNDVNAVLVKSGGRVLIPTGLRVAIPDGYQMEVRPRSGLAINKGLTVLNTPGTVDGDYRGEVGVILVNTHTAGVLIKDGERIAQAVIVPVVQADWKVVEKLSETARGEGGFGSTDKKDK